MKEENAKVYSWELVELPNGSFVEMLIRQA